MADVKRADRDTRATVAGFIRDQLAKLGVVDLRLYDETRWDVVRNGDVYELLWMPEAEYAASVSVESVEWLLGQLRNLPDVPRRVVAQPVYQDPTKLN